MVQRKSSQDDSRGSHLMASWSVKIVQKQLKTIIF